MRGSKGRIRSQYVPSGKSSARVVPLLVAASHGALLLAWPYQALIRVASDWRLLLIVCFAFGAGLAVLARHALVWGHCRSPNLALVAGTLVALIGWGASFYWDYREIAHLQAGQLGFGDYLALKRLVGWKVGSARWEGGMVTAIWVVEALLVLLWAPIAAFAGANRPYCEACGAFTRKRSLELRGVSAAEAQPLVDAGDLRGLIELSGQSGASLALAAALCPRCGAAGWLSAVEKRVVASGKRMVVAQANLVLEAPMTSEACAAFRERERVATGQKMKPLS